MRRPAQRPPPSAKLAPPRVAADAARPRLLELLDRAARRPVIWVEGPAGSGKTTLAASWARARAGRTLWYQLDERDRDPATFFYFLREAVRRVAPRRREPLPLLTPEYLGGVATYSRNFFDGVFERLGSAGLLVLDDFQELPEGAPLRRLLPEALGGIPDGIQVVVLSRAAPPPELSRLRANGLVATVGWDALRFTEGEAAGLLAALGLARPAPACLARLHAETDGWAAGLVLLGEAARRGESWAAVEEGWRPAELFDYFASELFDHADAPAQRLLLSAGLLPTVTPELAERLAGPGAGACLERLARQNFFTTRRAGAAPVYQFHPLFRAFLRVRAETALAPDERAELLRRAAALLDEAGQPEDAIALLQGAGDGPAAAALVRRLAPALEQQGRIQTLEAWIRALPDDVREGDPWMLHWLGVCRSLQDPRESVALHERAFAAFQTRADDAGCLAAWAGAFDALVCCSNEYAGLDPWLRWLEERMRRTEAFPSPELGGRVVASMVSGLLWRRPSHPDVEAWIERLEEIVRRAADPDQRARGLLTLAWYRAWKGDPVGLTAALAELRRACRARGVPAATRLAGLYIGASTANYAVADPAGALALATEGLRFAEAEGIHAFDQWLHGHAACAHLSRGDADAAAPHLEAMRRASGAGLVAGWYQLQTAAWRMHLVGQTDAALAQAERALEAAEAGGFTPGRTHASFQLAQLRRARGDGDAASRHLAAAEEGAASGRSAICAWACKLARAQLALDAGSRATCRHLLAEALGEGRERGFTNVPWWSAALVLEGLCEEALDAGIEREYVRRLIRLHDLVPDPGRPGAERWPFPVRIRALGRFVLEREGAPAKPAGRSKPLELLEALVALGGRDVPELRLAELLWPDAEGDLGRQRLKYTLHVLRRLLGPDDVLTLEKGLLSLDPRRVSVDAWDLDRHLDRLGAALERGQRGEVETSLARALAVRRGALLEAECAPWAVAARERHDARFLRLLLRGAAAVAETDPAAAAAHLQRALDLFPGEPRVGAALASARGADAVLLAGRDRARCP